MDVGWTPGGRQKQRSSGKDNLDDLLGDLLDDESPPKKKTPVNTAGRQQFSAKKQSSKDEDFYSSLAQAADEGDNISEVSEADVNQMARSIADLDDLDADLFQAGSGPVTKTPKRGSLKDKSGKSGTPRRTGTPRSRGGTPRATSPPLRLTSPANRVVSPTRITPTGRGTPTGRETPVSPPSSIDMNRPGSGSRKSPPKKILSPTSSIEAMVPEYRPSTAPGKMTDLGERASVGLKPGQEQERPRTVPKAKSIDFGDFDADDPLAGIPLSDEDEDLGLPAARKKLPKQQQQQSRAAENASPRASGTPVADVKPVESPRQRNMFDRPPTRSGSNKSETADKEVEQRPTPTVHKPAMSKKKAEEALFSDDDDFLGGLGIEEKTGAKPKVKAVEVDEEENRPAKSVMDKLLNKDSVSKHLEHGKERREFVLDSKYSKPTETKDTKEAAEDDFLFGSYKPSAVGSNSSRPTSRRSVRFQDDDDIFGLNDAPPAQPRSAAGKKVEDGMDWLEMATGGRAQAPVKTPDTKPADAKPAPAAAPAANKSKSPGADWLGLKSDDDDDDVDTDLSITPRDKLKFQPKAQETVRSKPVMSRPGLGGGREDLSSMKSLISQPESKSTGKDDYLGLGDEIDSSKLTRSKPETPGSVSGAGSRADTPGSGAGSKDILQEEDLFVGAAGSKATKLDDTVGKPKFESAARRREMTMSPRERSPRRSPERKGKDTSPRSLMEQLSQLQSSGYQKDTQHESNKQDLLHGQPPQQHVDPSWSTQQEPETDLNSSTDFFSMKKPVRDQTASQSGLGVQTTSQVGMQNTSQSGSGLQTGSQSGLPLQTGLQSGSRQSARPEIQTGLDTQTFSLGSTPSFQTDQQMLSGDFMSGSMQPNVQHLQQQQQMMQKQQQMRQQQMMKQLQRQQLQFQKQQQQQLQQLQQMQQQSIIPDTQMFSVDRPLFMDDMSFGLGGQVDMDAQSKIRRLEVELQYARDILTSTKTRYEEEIAAIENSYKSRIQLQEETHGKREQRWREENQQLLDQQLSKVKKMEEEKSELLSNMYKKLEEGEKEKSAEIERLRDIHRQALENIKKDNDESLARLKRSKDQQIEAAAASHDTSRSLVAAVEMIRTNAKDLGDLQRKIDNWNAQGLDDREITLRSKDEQLRMLQDRLNKQQEDNELERQKLQDLVGRLEAQIREQTRMLEEERWKVKQEQSRLQGMQVALEDERRAWAEHQNRERANMEKSREALLEEQKTTLSQLHKERQTLADEQVQFNMKKKMAQEEGGHFNIKTAQARAELEALTKAISEARDRYDTIKQDIRDEEEHIKEERRHIEKERAKMEKKEAELMDGANLIKDRSREMEEMYSEGQRKYEEGMAALGEAQRIEGEEGKRIDQINHQLNIMRLKEKEMAEERLRLSKEKREHEKFRNTLLCPNCRTPTRHQYNGNINSQPNSPSGLLIPTNGYQTNGVAVNPVPQGGYMAPAHPATQLTVNTVDAVTESIKCDRSVRLWKMEAMKDQKYLEEQSLFLHTLKYMPYSPKS